MCVLFRLLILFTVIPLVEVAILVRIAEALSWSVTFGLVLLTGVLGAWLARREGLKVLSRIQAELSEGGIPTDAMLDGALIVAAGLVLVTPGVLTDLCGFSLLVPVFRGWVKRRLKAAFLARHGWSTPRVDQGGSAPFVDVEATGRDADAAEDDGPGELRSLIT